MYSGWEDLEQNFLTSKFVLWGSEISFCRDVNISHSEQIVHDGKISTMQSCIVSAFVFHSLSCISDSKTSAEETVHRYPSCAPFLISSSNHLGRWEWIASSNMQFSLKKSAHGKTYWHETDLINQENLQSSSAHLWRRRLLINPDMYCYCSQWSNAMFSNSIKSEIYAASFYPPCQSTSSWGAWIHCAMI